MEYTIYHGSHYIIKKPQYGAGKTDNDYGSGFYCTEYLELAQEWACDIKSGGYANKYTLNTDKLSILNLNDKKYTILHWLSILLQNRKVTLNSEMERDAMQYILENFPIATDQHDIIIGYRANDSYFSFARDFLSNTISVQRLAQVMKLGNLGNQIVLKSKNAFERITFVDAIEAPQHIHFPLRKNRDELARISYLSNKKGTLLSPNSIYVLDLLRGGVKPDDPRLQ